ncbi:hypothetical protein JTE90_022616 [Oedothorax gibbosus]|uniref:TFIIS-type domain-containing protein n=1 Tax=Oedothorax gibbosus TaxID=931172 RepID=A0AAV6TTU7_9ARAC|nr:hypothetical protein JTE90_022616 [Oedothorax gibbosus]
MDYYQPMDTDVPSGKSEKVMEVVSVEEFEEPLFTEQELDSWTHQSEKPPHSCCDTPNISFILKQDRAIDEPPTVYLQCQSCRREMKGHTMNTK